MAAKIHIADVGNVFTPAYLALKQKGFTVSWRNVNDPEQELWFAEDDTRSFVASGPVELLGLIAMHEVRGDNWQAEDEEAENLLSIYLPNY